MADESDGVIEEAGGQMRVALMAATQMAEKFSRLREELARRAQAQTEQQTRELRVRFDADRNAARATVAPTARPEWWHTASVQDVAEMYQTARAWEDVDTDIAAHAQQMRYEIQNRYGLDVEAMHERPDALATAVAEVRREQEPSPVRDAMREFDAQRDAMRADVGATADARWWDSATPEQVAATYEKAAAWETLDPEVARSAERMRTELRDRYGVENAGAGQAALRDAVERDQRTRGDAAQQRTAAGVDGAQAGAYVAAADRLDREGGRRDREQYERDQADLTRADGSPEHAAANANRDAADNSYDSAERREAWAAEMEADGLTADQVQGRIAADRNQATHPRQAVQTKPRTSKARGKGQTQGIQRERGGLSR